MDIQEIWNKHSREIAVALLVVLFIVFIAISKSGYILLLGLAIYFIWDKSKEYKARAIIEQNNEAQYREHFYIEIANQLYELLREYEFLGLHLPNATSILYPNDYFRIRNNVLFFQYKVALRDNNNFQTECDALKEMLNERIAQDSYYQPLYIHQVKRSDNHIRLAVLINNSAYATAYIHNSEMNRVVNAAKQKSAPTDDEDF